MKHPCKFYLIVLLLVVFYSLLMKHLTILLHHLEMFQTLEILAQVIRQDFQFRTYNEGSSSHDLPEIGVTHDAVHNETEHISGLLPDSVAHHEQSAPSTNRKEAVPPIMEGPSVSGGASFSMPAHDKAQAVASADDLVILNTAISLGLFLTSYFTYINHLSSLLTPHMQTHTIPTSKKSVFFYPVNVYRLDVVYFCMVLILRVVGQQFSDVELQPSSPIKQQNARKKKRSAYYSENIVLTSV